MDIQPSKIPVQLHHLIGLAEKFGLADDKAREDAVANSSPEERRSLKDAVEKYDDAFDLWLAGPEAAGPEYSDEYIAFSALRIAADFA
ncbi:MAG: hypothetical protein ACJ8HJ_14645 [Massilia sp.]